MVKEAKVAFDVWYTEGIIKYVSRAAAASLWCSLIGVPALIAQGVSVP